MSAPGQAGDPSDLGRLTLTRREGERIVIETVDGMVTLHVGKMQKNSHGRGRVRIALDAPKSVRIVREELVEPARKRTG